MALSHPAAQPPLTSSSASASRKSQRWSSSQPYGSTTRRAVNPAVRAGASSDVGNGWSRSSPASRASSSSSVETMPRAAARLAADRETLEVPGDVLAEVGHAAVAPPSARPTARRAGAGCRRPHGDAGGRRRHPVEGRREFGEQPWSALAAAPDDHAVTAGLAPSCAARRPPRRCRRCPAPGC